MRRSMSIVVGPQPDLQERFPWADVFRPWAGARPVRHGRPRRSRPAALKGLASDDFDASRPLSITGPCRHPETRTPSGCQALAEATPGRWSAGEGVDPPSGQVLDAASGAAIKPARNP